MQTKDLLGKEPGVQEKARQRQAAEQIMQCEAARERGLSGVQGWSWILVSGGVVEMSSAGLVVPEGWRRAWMSPDSGGESERTAHQECGCRNPHSHAPVHSWCHRGWSESFSQAPLLPCPPFRPQSPLHLG